MANERFSDIWDAIETDPVERERMKLLSQLMDTLQNHIQVTQQRVSDLMRGKIDLFSIDAIVTMLVASGVTVKFQTRRAA